MMKKLTFPVSSLLSGITFTLLFTGVALPLLAQRSGNPILSGDHPDPEVRIFNGKYYIYPTNEGPEEFHAYSSDDLTNWVDEGAIFSLRRDCSWANINGWAPSVIERNGTYYLYYTAEAKIGVATSTRPTGPFVDLGRPFIGSDPFTVDIIDAMAYIDDDGQAYLYYGGSNGARMVVRKLNPDMVSFASGPMDITPPNFTEAPFMVKRDGVYYLMYSNGSWFNETYNVQYSTATSPLGPWTYGRQILSSADNMTGPGHHSVIQMPGCDDYYMVYHRYDNGQNFRTCHMDRMYFNPDGSIRKVKMTTTGVAARTPTGSPCSPGNILSGATYTLIHKGTNQALDVAGNSPNPDANVQQYTDNRNDAQRWIITQEVDGHFKLRHKGTNQCLDVTNNSNADGANVIQYTDNGGDAQRWMLRAMADGYYKLIHKNTNKCLDVENNSRADGANVQQYTDNGNDAQRWKIRIVASTEIVSDGVYELEPACAPGKRLDVAGGGTGNGTNVQLYERNDNVAQGWQIRGVGNGLWELIPQVAPNQRLDVAGGQDVAGSNMHLYQANRNPAQRFRFLDQGNGYYEIVPEVAPGKRLDVANIRQDNGTNVLMWNDLNNDAQRWRLIRRNGIPEPVQSQPLTAASFRTSATAEESRVPFPNPFVDHLTFPLQLESDASAVDVRIFDVAGKLFRTLRYESLAKGPHQLTWNGKSTDGHSLESGVHVYKITVDGKTIQGKFIKGLAD